MCEWTLPGRNAGADRHRRRGEQPCDECRAARKTASRRWREANPGAPAAYGRRELASLQQAVFGHYGWACACCGTTERPTIDHISGGGSRFGGVQFYRWLVASGLPEGFQTLCLSCNASKSSGEQCRLDHRKPCSHCDGSGREPQPRAQVTRVREEVLAESNGHGGAHDA